MSNYVLTPSAVRKLRGALAATPGNSGATGAPSPVNIDDYPPPFTVRWSASANNKRGTWVIWLPDVAQLVRVGNAYVSQINNTVAEVALPAGWYRMSHISATATAVWLIIRTSTLTGAVRVYPSESPEQPQTGYTISSILVATMATDAQTGAKRVKQYVDSAVVLGGDSAPVVPDDISTEFIPDPPEGTQPDGDEGQLQIKDWKDPTASVDQNTLSDYLQGAVVGGGGSNYQVLVRAPQVGASPALGYVPIGELFKDTSGGGQPQDKTVTYIGDMRWNMSEHTLQMRKAVLNLRKGEWAWDTNTPSGDGWVTITNGTTTAISDIV